MRELADDSSSIHSIQKLDLLSDRLRRRALAIDINCKILRVLEDFLKGPSGFSSIYRPSDQEAISWGPVPDSGAPAPHGGGPAWYIRRCNQLGFSMQQQYDKIHSLLNSLESAARIVSTTGPSPEVRAVDWPGASHTEPLANARCC